MAKMAVQNALFALLRVIFARRFVLPELYDLVGLLGAADVRAKFPGRAVFVSYDFFGNE